MDKLIYGAFDAKTHLPELLRRVERGESITITKHGRAVARLVPAKGMKKPSVQAVIEDIKRLRLHGPTLGENLTLEELVASGRRY
jgi:prevent-host-death family protein